MKTAFLHLLLFVDVHRFVTPIAQPMITILIKDKIFYFWK